MKNRLLSFCDSYHENPDLWVVRDEENLKYRYRDLQLRETSELRLDSLCADDHDGKSPSAVNSAESQ